MAPMVRDELKDLLIQRLRAALWLLLAGIVTFGLTDPVTHPDRLVPLWMLIAFEMTLALGVLWRLGRPIGTTGAVVYGLVVSCALCVTTAASGIIADDAVTTPVILLVLTMSAATLLPWGLRPQLIVQVVASLAILWNVHAVNGLHTAGSLPVAVLMGAVAALYAASAASRYHTERRRAEEAEAEVRAREHQAGLAHAARLSTVGGMAAGLAHEINQPLAAIVSYARGCAHRIRAGEVPPETLLEVIEQMSAQAMRASEVLRRIHTFVRSSDVPRQRVDLNTLVIEALHFVEVEARQRGVTLRLTLAPGPLEVSVDPIQIEQVILNFVRNGFEAMAMGEGVRELGVETLRVGADAVAVRVTDTGPGVPTAVVARLFDPFFTTKREGLGLGLSISRSIAEAHEGRLDVTSNVPRGATFQLALPLAA